MKKSAWVALVIVMEAVALWIVSLVFTWNVMDVLFLGSLAIFAIVWLTSLWTNQANNAYNGEVKGWTGQNAGGVKQFHVRFSPIMIGMVMSVIISLIATVVYYAEYF